MLDRCYRSGSLVLGGGHLVLRAALDPAVLAGDGPGNHAILAALSTLGLSYHWRAPSWQLVAASLAAGQWLPGA